MGVNKDNALKRLCESKNIGLSQLSRLSGVNLKSLQRYKSGAYAIENMTLMNAKKVADALQVNIEDLLVERKEVSMNNLKVEEKGGFRFLAGNWVDDINNDNSNAPGLHMINCDIESYDEDGVYFDTRDTSQVYILDESGNRMELL